MDAAVFGSRNGLRLELRPVHREPAAELQRWEVLLTGDDLNAALEVAEAGWEPASLGDFVAGLAADWRGWAGERLWQSEEAELRLRARHDKTNTVLVTVDLEDGPRWRCNAELELDPGALQEVADAVRSLSGPPRP